MKTWILLATLCLAGCRADAPEPVPAANAAVAAPQVATRFAPETGVNLNAMQRLEPGVWIQDVRAGAGPAAARGNTVIADYKAWLPDGTLYEQRPSEGWGPAEFVLEPGAAPVPGLAFALEGMRTGGTRRVVVPPDLGYGLLARPPEVPEDATLVFEVRLRSVR